MISNETTEAALITDDLFDSKEITMENISFTEINKLKRWLDMQLPRKSKPKQVDLDRHLYIVDYYQESPQLLDPHLDSIIKPMVEIILDAILTEAQPIEDINYLFQFLYRLVKTRGYKTIIKFFSHQVSHLEPCIKFLQTISSDKPYWEMRYIMLLWISLIAMVPFDLKLIDSGPDVLVSNILSLAKHYLDSISKEYQGAAILAMRVLTRYL
jgi:hypothetical protein